MKTVKGNTDKLQGKFSFSFTFLQGYKLTHRIYSFYVILHYQEHSRLEEHLTFTKIS